MSRKKLANSFSAGELSTSTSSILGLAWLDSPWNNHVWYPSMKPSHIKWSHASVAVLHLEFKHILQGHKILFPFVELIKANSINLSNPCRYSFVCLHVIVIFRYQNSSWQNYTVYEFAKRKLDVPRLRQPGFVHDATLTSKLPSI